MKDFTTFHLTKVSGRTIDGLSKDDLISMARAGMIDPNDEIRKEGHASCHLASEVTGLLDQPNVLRREKTPKSNGWFRRLVVKTSASLLIITLVICLGIWGIWFAMSDTQKGWATEKYETIIAVFSGGSENISGDVVVTDTFQKTSDEERYKLDPLTGEDDLKDIDWHINAAFEAQDACQQIDARDAESVLEAFVMVLEVLESIAANKNALQKEYNSMSVNDQQRAVWQCRQIKWGISQETKKKLAKEGTLARDPRVIERIEVLGKRMQWIGQAAEFAPFSGHDR